MVDNINKAYFIGIGGIGMSALARYLLSNDIKVSGYDRDQTELISELRSEGMTIYHREDIAHIEEDVDVIIYTPAIPDTHLELIHCRQHNLPLYKRSEALKEILKNQKVIAVAGTHGKTSTSAILSHLLHDGGVPITGFVGGVLKGYQSNFVHSGNEWIVVEADEYDRSFMRLFPTIAVIQAMDADHLDIYGDKDALIESFRDFTLQIVPGGTLWVKYDIMEFWNNEGWIEALGSNKVAVKSFGVDEARSDYSTYNMNCVRGMMSFDMDSSGEKVATLGMPGLHNLYNATAALAVSESLGVDRSLLVGGLSTFQGIQRRYEIVFRGKDLVVVDDYAHHPVEITAAIEATRANFHNLKLTVLFQPHLFSRTADFHLDFAKALDLADEVILFPIYPARELPVQGVTSELIYDNMNIKEKKLDSMSAWLEESDLGQYELLLVLGAGDISKLIAKILIKLK